MSRVALRVLVLAVEVEVAAAQVPAPSANATQADIRQVESCLPTPVAIKGKAKSCVTLAQRMADFHVSGVSIAVVHNGAIESAKGYGIKDAAGRSCSGAFVGKPLLR